MAVKYLDGWGVWALNGVRVPRWLAETKAEDLDVTKFATIENAEHKREFVRKVGVERMLSQVPHKQVGRKRGHYSLLRLNFGTGDRLYLKMRNPSIGCWHVEPVHPNCKTVQEALNYRRFGTDPSQVKEDWRPEIVT